MVALPGQLLSTRGYATGVHHVLILRLTLVVKGRYTFRLTVLLTKKKLARVPLFINHPCRQMRATARRGTRSISVLRGPRTPSGAAFTMSTAVSAYELARLDTIRANNRHLASLTGLIDVLSLLTAAAGDVQSVPLRIRCALSRRPAR